MLMGYGRGRGNRRARALHRRSDHETPARSLFVQRCRSQWGAIYLLTIVLVRVPVLIARGFICGPIRREVSTTFALYGLFVNNPAFVFVRFGAAFFYVNPILYRRFATGGGHDSISQSSSTPDVPNDMIKNAFRLIRTPSTGRAPCLSLGIVANPGPAGSPSDKTALSRLVTIGFNNSET